MKDSRDSSDDKEAQSKEVQTQNAQGYSQAIPTDRHRQIGPNQGRPEPFSKTYFQALQALVLQNDCCGGERYSEARTSARALFEKVQGQSKRSKRRRQFVIEEHTT